MDMHQQPKYLPYEPTTFFDDGRSERPVVPGTVARGHLHLDELLYTGKENGVLANKFPFPITREDLERGRQRYNIYCTPCHDYTGSGQGIVVQRGFPPPPSVHTARLHGDFYDASPHRRLVGLPDPPPARSRHAHFRRDGASIHPDFAGHEAH